MRSVSPDDPQLRDCERNILDHLRSNKFLNIPGMRPFGQLFRILSNTNSYGPTIQHTALRHTMIWFSSVVECSNVNDEEIGYHKYMALHSLVRDWDKPAALNEGHLFAVWLMAIIAARDLSQNSYSQSLEAFFFILRDISQKPRFHGPIWPMLRDQLVFASFRHFEFFDSFSFSLRCFEDACGDPGPTSASQRHEYERQLGLSTNSWTVSNDFFFPTLLHYSITLRQLFQETVDDERLDWLSRNPGFYSTLHEVKSGLQAQDVQKAWGAIMNGGLALENLRAEMKSFSTPIEECRRSLVELWLELDMSAMSVILYEFCQLLIWILGEPSILQALRARRVTCLATEIISRLQCITELECGDHSGKRWKIFDHLKQRSLFMWLVWIAGLACPDEGCSSLWRAC